MRLYAGKSIKIDLFRGEEGQYDPLLKSSKLCCNADTNWHSTEICEFLKNMPTMNNFDKVSVFWVNIIEIDMILKIHTLYECLI